MSGRIVQEEINEIKSRIQKHYPDAVIRVHYTPRPRIVNIDVYTDGENPWAIQDLITLPRMHALTAKDYLISVVPQPLRYLPRAAEQRSNRLSTTAPKRKANVPRLRTRERKTRYRADSKRAHAKT